MEFWLSLFLFIGTVCDATKLDYNILASAKWSLYAWKKGPDTGGGGYDNM